jgi:hypothetical protein
MGQKIIWLVDENELEIRTSYRALFKMLPKSVKIEVVFPPFSSMTEYNALLLNPDTVSIIIDQRLKDTGIANYTGIELANYIRSINTKLPIYILTNFSGDFEKFTGRGWSVEDILDKGDFSGADELRKEITARIIRRIDVFDDILADREHRFHELLTKSLSQELSDEDFVELRKLQEARVSAVLADEIGRVDELARALEKYKGVINKLEGIHGKNE